jgi:serine/threonine protein kinase
VAIKVLPASSTSDPGRRARFKREARAIAQHNHPHICTLYDVGEEDGIDYLVIELVEGDTLEERLKKGPLSPTEALQYGEQIAEALCRGQGRTLLA